MTDKTHDHCATCDWLAREAERTARGYHVDHWTSSTTDRDGTVHTASWSDPEGTP